MPYNVELPDGRVVEFPDEVSKEDAERIIRRQLGIGPQPKQGFIPNVKAGIESLKGSGYALAAGVTKNPEYAKEAKRHAEKAEDIGAIPEFSESPWEYLKGIAGRSAAYMGAPIAAGAVLTPYGRLASIAAGLGTSATQFTGSNLARQLQEGKTAEELELGPAVAAAAPQAALDVVGFRFIPGIRRLFGAAGVQIGNKEAAGIVSKYILPAAKASGVEGVTEAGQAVLERLQAGLEIDSPEARKEYFDNFLGGAVLGGALSIPGSAIEGMRGKPPVAPPTPPQETAPAPTPEAPAQVESPLVSAEGVPALPAPEQRLALEYDPNVQPAPTAPLALAAPETAALEAPASDVVSLMDEYKALETKREELAQQIPTLRSEKKYDEAYALAEEHDSVDNRLKELTTQIEELGGYTGDFGAYEESVKTKVAKLDKRIKQLQDEAEKQSDPDVRDYAAARKADEARAKVEAQREQLLEELTKKESIARVQSTEKGENIPLFMPEDARPEPKNMLTLQSYDKKGKPLKETKTAEDVLASAPAEETAEPTPVEANADKIAEKEAEAVRLQKELSDMSPRYNAENKLVNTPKAANEEQRAAVMQELNDTRARYRDLQERSGKLVGAPTAYYEQMDAVKQRLSRRISELELQLEGMSQRGATRSFITQYNEKSGQLDRLYAEIDALRSGKPLEAGAPPLFTKRNQLATAATTGDIDAIRRLEEYDENLKRTETKEKEPTPAEQVKELLDSFVTGRVRSERRTFEGAFDRVEADVQKLKNKIFSVQGNAKNPFIKELQYLEAQVQAAQKTIRSRSSDAKAKGYAKRDLPAKKEKLRTMEERFGAIERDIGYLRQSLREVTQLGTEEEVAAAKQAATNALGTSKREKSREQKRAERQLKGTMKASEDRVAREVGEQSDTYEKRSVIFEAQRDALRAEFNKYKAGLKALVDKARKEHGEHSDSYKRAESTYVKAMARKQSELDSAIKESVAQQDEVKKKLGRSDPWFHSHLFVANKAVKIAEDEAGVAKLREQLAAAETEAAATEDSPKVAKKVAALDAVINDPNATQEQKDAAKKERDFVRRARASKGTTAESKLTNLKLSTVKSKRTTQETRKLAKLSNMATASPESRAATEKRQAGFMANLNEDKGSVADYKAKNETIEKAAKKVPAKESQTTVGNAMREAAAKKLASKKEEPKQLRGSEGESKSLTPEQVTMLENNELQKALGSIIDDKDNSDVNRAVAYALESFLDATNVKVHDRLVDPKEGYEILGQATSKQIDLSREGLTQETLLHEGVHSAVERVIRMAQQNFSQLSKEQQNAYRELERLFNAIKNDTSITSKNAKSSISEFAAEALSNERLQEQLRNKKWTFGDAFKSFASYLLKLIGVKNVDNMRDASFAAIEALMIPSSAARGVVETPSQQIKDSGVFQKAAGVFGFKSFTEKGGWKSSIVAEEPGIIDELKANFLGLAGRVQYIDRYAALSEAFKKGVEAGVISDLEASNGEYFLRFGENRSQYAQQALTNGPNRLIASDTKKGGKEYIFKSEAGANLMSVFDKLQKSGIKNSRELDDMFTVYMAGMRANQVGWEKLWVGDSTKAKDDYAEVMRRVNADPAIKSAFEAAAKEYKTFNNGLIDFLVDTGAMRKEQASKLKAIDYVPYYRVNKGSGDVEMFVDKELPVRIGNIKDEPQLQELVGDNTQILPLSVSAVQNAFILTDMGLRNQRVKDSAFLLHKMGIASRIGPNRVERVKNKKAIEAAAAKGVKIEPELESVTIDPSGRNVVRFKKDGQDWFVVVDSEQFGIPAQLILRGMEGIQTTMPAILNLMGKPADLIRTMVTRNPAYAVRQAVRDPLTAWLTTGVDGVPVMNSLKELSKMVAGRSDTEKKLMEAGAISSNVFSGDQRDFKKFMHQVASGRPGWAKLLAKADAFAMQGDAATRAVIYNDSLAKGMSEQQALLRTLESMNFGRRGVSPTMHALNVLIPFFNAQVQGLDVLYRAFKGKMPYSEQMEIKKKLYTRGLMLAAGTLAYAAMMEDDDTYKKAKPEERLGNWFVPIPGTKDMLKVPIPFELGYLFKALPEAVFNLAADDERSKDVTKGMGKLLMMSNPFSLPQAIKPATEAYLNSSFFGGDIESQREIKTMLPEKRYRANTTELAKFLGSMTGEAGLTPIKIDYLIRGYTGALGTAVASLPNALLESGAPDVAEPSKKLSELSFIGGLFQPAEGRGLQDASYARMLEIQETKGTYKRMLEQGDKEGAKELLEDKKKLLQSASTAGRAQQKLGELAKKRRAIVESPRLSQEQKDALLEKIDAVRNAYAEKFLAATD